MGKMKTILRNIHTSALPAILLALLFVTLAQQAAAATYTYTYYILNNRGVVTLWNQVKKEYQPEMKPEITDDIASPLVKEYHYYLASDVTQDTSTGKLAWKFSCDGAWRTDNSLIGTFTINKDANELEYLPEGDAKIYVKYDVVDNYKTKVDGVTLDISGKTKYNIMHTTDSRYAYYSSDRANAGTVSDATTLLKDAYLWTFEGDDPYDVIIRNVAGGSNKYLQSDPKGLENSGEFEGRVKAPVQNNWSSNYILESFVIVKGQEGSFEIMATHFVGYHYSTSTPRYIYWGANTDNLGFFNLVPPGTESLNFGDCHLKDRTQLTLTAYEAKDVTFHIIDLSGKEAISASGSISGSNIELPSDIRSPLAETYHFYRKTDFDISEDGTYTLKAGAKAMMQVADVDVSDIYVTYEYHPSQEINITATLMYKILATPSTTTGNFFYVGEDRQVAIGTDAGQPSEYLWMFKANTVNGNPDPYDIRLINHKYPGYHLGASDLNATVELVADGTECTYDRFIVMSGSGALRLMARANAVDGMYTYLESDGTNVILSRADDATMQSALVSPINQGISYTYHIVNHSDEIAIEDEADDLSALTVPASIKSPLASNFRFYTLDQYTVSGNKYTLNEDATPLTVYPPVTVSDIYVEYDYDATTADLDLSGSTDYNLFIGEKYLISRENISNNGGGGNDRSDAVLPVKDSDGNETVNGLSITNSRCLWNLTGSDPYAVVLVNKKWPDHFLGKSASDDSNKYTNFFNKATTTDVGVSSYFVFSDANGGYVLVYYSGGYFYYLDTSGSYPQFKTWSRTTGNTLKYVFTPQMTRIYQFHLTRKASKVSGEELTEEMEAHIGSVINLPKNMQRKFCEYTYYSDKELTMPIEDGKYPYVDKVEGENAVDMDIYVDYTCTLPFTTCSSYDDATWYYLMFHPDNNYKAQGNTDNYNYAIYPWNDNGRYFMRWGPDGRYEMPDDAKDDATGIIWGNATLNYVNEYNYLRKSRTYLDPGADQPHPERWHWAFNGDSYDLTVINREAGKNKRLAYKYADGTTPEEAVSTNPYLYFTASSENVLDAWEIIDFSLNGVTNDILKEESKDGFGLKVRGMDNMYINIGGNGENYRLKLVERTTIDQSQSFLTFPDEEVAFENVKIVVHDNAGNVVYTEEFTAGDRRFAKGDVVSGTTFINDGDAIPVEVTRHFCKYNRFGGEAGRNEAVKEGGTVSFTGTMGEGYTIGEPGGDGWQTVYIEYELSENNLFMGDGETPADNPEKVWFVDGGLTPSADLNILPQHFNTGIKEYDSDTEANNQFVKMERQTLFGTNNRFTVDDPQKLKFYFRGNPYKTQMFVVDNPEQNLRPLPTEQALNIRKYRYELIFDGNKASGKDFYWEMVDSRRFKDESFALRFKETNGFTYEDFEGTDVTDRVNGMYYYLRQPRTVSGNNDVVTNGNRVLLSYETANPTELVSTTEAGKKVYHTMHKANIAECALTIMAPAKVQANVYKSTNLFSPVTRGELSEYYGVGEKFIALPENIKRMFCDYTRVNIYNAFAEEANDTVTLTMPSYQGTHYIAAKYTVWETAPFVKDPTMSPEEIMTGLSTRWFNLGVGGNNYAYFDRNYIGTNGSNLTNESAITVKSGAIQGQNVGDNFKFHKGLQWAFVGDPYEFYAINRRYRTAEFDDTGYNMLSGTVGYLSGNGSSLIMTGGTGSDKTTDEYRQTHFTFMLNPASSGNYFISYSQPRMTAQDVSSGNYNLKKPNSLLTITGGGNYSLGDNVQLIRVDKETDAATEEAYAATYGTAAMNPAFDCIVNVYNGNNKIVATSGWTELPRYGKQQDYLPMDVKRYGCAYRCWADATMTLKEVTNFDEKVRRSERNDWDGTGDGDETVYLLDDGCIIFTTYTYDPSIYSTENEKRWMNCHFEWDRVTSRTYGWSKEDAVNWKKTEVGGTTAHNRWGDKWTSVEIASTVEHMTRYMSQSVLPTAENMDTLKVRNAIDDRSNVGTDDANYNGMKWALVGDPYEFYLKNYYMRSSTNFKNHYLYSDKVNSQLKYSVVPQVQGGTITDDTPIDQTFETELTGEQKQGFTYTYKVDADGKGYLAVKDEGATALAQRGDGTELVGAVKKYVSFSGETTAVKDIGLDANETWTPEPENNNITVMSGDGAGNYTKAETDTYTRGTYYRINEEVYETVTKAEDGNMDASYPPKELEDNGTMHYHLWQLPFTDEKGAPVTKKQYSMEPTPAEGTYLVPTGGVTKEVNTLNLGTGDDKTKQFVVEPPEDKAASVTFRLKIYRKADVDNGTVKLPQPQPADGEPLEDDVTYLDNKDLLAEGETYPITLRNIPKEDDYLSKDYYIKDYGVGNDLVLPWSYRRQFCKYFYRVARVSTDGENQDEALADSVGKWHTELVPAFEDKHVLYDVYYRTTEDFVASTTADDAYWYNLSSVENTATPDKLAHFSYTNDIHSDSRKGHYTDDWLWAVEGDPYGMRLHNRYAQTWDETLTIPVMPLPTDLTEIVDSVSGGSARLDNFTNIVYKPQERGSHATITNDDEGTTQITKVEINLKGEVVTRTEETATNTRYFDMMEGNYDNAFLLHPLTAEMQEHYPAFCLTMFVFNAGTWPMQINEMQDREAKRNVSANWKLNQLMADQLLPYYERRGYVGGLLPEKAEEMEADFASLTDGTAKWGTLRRIQKAVHNPANLVPLKEGYYRLHVLSSDGLARYESDKTAIKGTRYATGYLTDSELTARVTADENGEEVRTAVPLNLRTTTADSLGTLLASDLPDSEFYRSFNTEMTPAEYDPASIFHFAPVEASAEDGSKITNTDRLHWTVSTQGLYLKNDFTMTTEEDTVRIDDIGGTVFTLRRGYDMKVGYMHCSPDSMRFVVNTYGTELHEKDAVQDTKWLLQPVGTDTGNNEMPLKISTLDGQDGKYYATLCVPYDVALPATATAYVVPKFPVVSNGSADGVWDVVCEPTGSQIVPANTAVMICSDEPDIEAWLPYDAPTETFAGSNVLEGKNLSQQLTGVDGSRVYVFGMVDRVMNFYKNANANPYNDNRRDGIYVAHNKAYIVMPDNATGAKALRPVFLDGGTPDGIRQVTPDATTGDGTIYDLQGRRVDKPRQGVYIVNGKKLIMR